MLFQVLKRSRRILECRPIPDRPPVLDTVFVSRLNPPLLGETLVDDRQQLPIPLRGCVTLLAGLVARVRLEDLVAAERPPRSIGQAFQGLDHAALPIDQGAVAIES